MVSDLYNENLNYINEKHHSSNVYLTNNYQKIINSKDINLIHICTPNETHFQICKEALMRNKNVLIEKPMTTNSQEAFELVKIAQENNLILQTGLIFRFNNALTKIKDLVKNNYFGNIYYIKLQWTNLMPAPIGRDIIFDLMPHSIDIINFLFDEWPNNISCLSKAYSRNGLEDMAILLAELNNSKLVQIEVSWLHPRKKRELIIIGSSNCAFIDCLNQTIELYDNEKQLSHDLENKFNNTIKDEILHFISSVKNGTNSNNTGYLGAYNVKILENIKKVANKNHIFQEKMEGL
jgi:predicted dehydrogenase